MNGALVANRRSQVIGFVLPFVTRVCISLFESLVTQVKWFDSKTDALAWFKGHDWEGDYSWHTEEQKEYLQKAITILSTN